MHESRADPLCFGSPVAWVACVVPGGLILDMYHACLIIVVKWRDFVCILSFDGMSVVGRALYAGLSDDQTCEEQSG
jgi:hypothetical protein